jgi:dipeptidyl aminopeptidase/acylaminoacyl peptidase
MPRCHFRCRMAAGLVVLLAMAGAAWAQAPAAPPPPAESFVRSPQLVAAHISPSGQRVALIVTTPAGRRVVAVRTLAEGGSTKTVGAFADADVYRVRWVNDDRVVFDAFQPGAEIEEGGAGSFAVNHDGEHYRELIAWRSNNAIAGSRIERRGLPYGWFVWGTLDDGSDDILVYRRTTDGSGDAMLGALARLNTRTGALTSLSSGAPPFATNWVLDNQRQLRVVATQRDGRSQLHWKKPGTEAWTVVLDEAALDAGSLAPRFLENDGSLIVEGRNGRDTSALFALDLASARLDPEPLVALSGFDLDAALETDSRTRQVVGVHTRASRPVSVWFDERLAGIQAAVDAALPGRYNKLHCGRCQSTQHFIVFSQSDNHPGEFLHYDHGKRSLQLLGARLPWVAPAQQGRRSFHRVPARDGLVLPLVVTHPPGVAPDAKPAAALPTVVLVHGGPWLRGSDLRWDGEAQFLATRGYRVLEVEFRGSVGFGWRHFRAGWKQWGTSMQDDLADAVAWAAKEGLTDAGRVCLVGASYGGYAALMSLIRHPDVYRCGVSFAGVTDIGLRYNARWGDLSEQGRRFTLPALMGDLKDDAELLKASSPLARVAEIKRPVLLAWGLLDRRVPEEHAERFVKAARAAGVKIETMSWGEEGHGFFNVRNHADYLRRVEGFLARELAP